MGHTVTMHRWTVLIVVTLSFSYLVTCLPGKYYLVETYDDKEGRRSNDYMDDVEEEKYPPKKRLNTYKRPEKKEYEKQEKYTTAEPQIEPYKEEPEAQLDAGYKENEEYEEEAQKKEEEEYDQNEGFEEARRKRNRRRRRNRSRRM